MKLTRTLIIAGALSGIFLINGCAPLLVGGTAVTTATVVSDRRTTGAIVNDEILEKRVGHELSEILKLPNHITVTSYNGRVLLSGEVGSAQEKQLAYRTATSSVDVRDVIDELAVMPPVSYPQRMADSMLATKVRTTIIGTKQISLNQMKVVVDRGIVYLMGILTPREAQLAARSAVSVSGVTKVVKCFTVESEEAIYKRLHAFSNKSEKNK